MFSQLPMFQRIGAAAYKADLKNTIAICNLLDNPQLRFKSIHIAGTNGKGSVSHLLASILQEAGYKTALYTSPHLKDFRERIKVNGEMIPEKYITSFVDSYKKDFKIIKPSFFEMTFGMAMKYFSESEIDIAVIETGMGGRLDSTNVVDPVLTVITNISLDHTAFLGDTLENIAIEKAGIIKAGVPVVIGQSSNATKKIFLQSSKEMKSAIYFADKIFSTKSISSSCEPDYYIKCNIFSGGKLFLKDLCSPLSGIYQIKNFKTVLQAIELIKNAGYNISSKSIHKGFENVILNTGLKGRWTVLNKCPLTICDIGHNEDGIKHVLKQIRLTPHKKLHFVIGMVNDKDHTKILSMLPKRASYYFCRPNIPRGLDQNILAAEAHKMGLKGNVFNSVSEAFSEAKLSSKNEDLIFIGGSTFVVAEVV
jgi:dihydrofolate synthase/folylpolyglutamate synthase